MSQLLCLKVGTKAMQEQALILARGFSFRLFINYFSNGGNFSKYACFGHWYLRRAWRDLANLAVGFQTLYHYSSILADFQTSGGLQSARP